MKRLFTILAFVSFLGFSGFAKAPVAQGNTHCCLGNYVVDKAIEQVYVDGKALRTFIVTYENSDLTVRIGVDRSNKKSTKYVVISDDLEIMYQCTDNRYFGVKRLTRDYLDDGFSTSDLSLDRQQYYHQKVITQLPKSEIDHVRLISVFFPKLVKDYEKVFAVR